MKRILVLSFAVMLLARVCSAAVLPAVNLAGVGTFGQGAPGILDPTVSCAPTSVYDSFVYLESRYGPRVAGLLGVGAPDTINALAADMQLVPGIGCTGPNIVSGTIGYLESVGLINVISVESQVGNNIVGASGQFLYDQLARGQGVEVGFTWNSGSGGHVVAVTGISNFDTGALTATLDFMDPWGALSPAGPGANALALSGNLSFAGGLWTLSYSGGAAGAGAAGTLALIEAESVPEPSTVYLVIGALLLLVWRRRVRT